MVQIRSAPERCHSRIGAIVQFDTFLMERNQTLFENGVEINLTESGVHPCTIEEIMPADAAQALLRLPLGYGWTDGRPELRSAIAGWYPGASASNVLVTNGSSEATMIALMAHGRSGRQGALRRSELHAGRRPRARSGDRCPAVAADARSGMADRSGCARASAASGAKLITVTNPGNPTGAVLSAGSREALLEAAARQGPGCWSTRSIAVARSTGRRRKRSRAVSPRPRHQQPVEVVRLPRAASRLDRRARGGRRGGRQAAGLHHHRQRHPEPDPAVRR